MNYRTEIDGITVYGGIRYRIVSEQDRKFFRWTYTDVKTEQNNLTLAEATVAMDAIRDFQNGTHLALKPIVNA